MLVVRDLHRSFEVGRRTVQALRGVSFEVAAGEIVGLVGPNGAGKTTTMAIIGGLVRPDRGEVWFDGAPVDPLAPRPWLGAWIGETGLYGHLSGIDHLRVVAGLKGIRLDRRAAEAALAEVGLPAHDAVRPVGSYSTGMRQRLAVACAVVGDPPVLVLDEPTSGLDPEGIRTLLDLLLAAARRGHAVLLSSHRLAEVESVCDRVVMIQLGRTVDLSDRLGRVPVLRIRSDTPEEVLAAVPGRVPAVRIGRSLTLVAEGSVADLLPAAVAATAEQGTATLEELFLLYSSGELHL